MDKSNKIENLANKYVERHIRDRHLSDDTIKEIKIAYIMIIKDFIAIVDKSTSMNEDDIIYVVNNISSILYEPVEISNTDKKILDRSLFQLAVSERHINGIGYGSLLPTVQTQGLKVCDKDGKTRFMDLSSLPKQGIKYGDLLPTPVASDHTGSCTIRKMTKSNGAPRIDSLRNMPAVIGMDGDRLNGRVFQLSPLFVEEMMGYPLMWTTLPFLTGNGEKNQ